MPQFDKITLGRQARELGFVRDTFEKVCRLAEVLSFMEQDPVLADSLALKGGTAINLTIFDLPRLSVDIDLDFSKNVSRDDMLAERKEITDHLSRYMTAAGYTLSAKSKQYHALDSFVYEYTNAGGAKDNLKIEINYMLRCHVLPLERRPVKLPWLKEKVNVLAVAPLEIFAAKIVALLSRTAPAKTNPPGDPFMKNVNRCSNQKTSTIYKKNWSSTTTVAASLPTRSICLNDHPTGWAGGNTIKGSQRAPFCFTSVRAVYLCLGRSAMVLDRPESFCTCCGCHPYCIHRRPSADTLQGICTSSLSFCAI